MNVLLPFAGGVTTFVSISAKFGDGGGDGAGSGGWGVVLRRSFFFLVLFRFGKETEHVSDSAL